MKPAFLLSCLTAMFACTGIAQEQPGFLQTYCVKVLRRNLPNSNLFSPTG